MCGDKVAYAKALLALEELRSPAVRFALSSKGGSLLQRISHIIDQPQLNDRPNGWAVGLSLVAIAVTLLSLAVLSPRVKRQQVIVAEGKSKELSVVSAPLAVDSSRLEQPKEVDDKIRRTKLAADENDAQFALLCNRVENSVSVKFAKVSAEFAKTEWEKAIEANRKVTGAISDVEIERARLNYVKAALLIEQAEHQQQVQSVVEFGLRKSDELELTRKSLELLDRMAKVDADIAKAEYDRAIEAKRRFSNTTETGSRLNWQNAILAAEDIEAQLREAQRLEQQQRMAGQFVGRVRLKTEQKPLPELEKRDLPAGRVPDESLVFSKDGGLANVFVYLWKPKFKIVGPQEVGPRQPFVLTARGGRYEPHAAVVRVGQALEFVNAQSVSDNLRSPPIKGNPLNLTFSPISRRELTPFTLAENLPVLMKSDIHPWMQAYLFPLDHPFAAVTDADGRFEINGLPPGEHEFRLWHEWSGYLEKSYRITIKPNEGVRAEFQYEPTRVKLTEAEVLSWGKHGLEITRDRNLLAPPPPFPESSIAPGLTPKLLADKLEAAMKKYASGYVAVDFTEERNVNADSKEPSVVSQHVTFQGRHFFVSDEARWRFAMDSFRTEPGKTELTPFRVTGGFDGQQTIFTDSPRDPQQTLKSLGLDDPRFALSPRRFTIPNAGSLWRDDEAWKEIQRQRLGYRFIPRPVNDAAVIPTRTTWQLSPQWLFWSALTDPFHLVGNRRFGDVSLSEVDEPRLGLKCVAVDLPVIATHTAVTTHRVLFSPKHGWLPVSASRKVDDQLVAHYEVTSFRTPRDSELPVPQSFTLRESQFRKNGQPVFSSERKSFVVDYATATDIPNRLVLSAAEEAKNKNAQEPDTPPPSTRTKTLFQTVIPGGLKVIAPKSPE